MKNLFFLCIMMLTMTSCATIIETGDNSVRALRQVERFVNAAGPVTSRIDRNSGALVNKSSRTTYTYSVQLGTLRLQNNGVILTYFNMTERVGLHMTGWTRPATVTKNPTMPLPTAKCRRSWWMSPETAPLFGYIRDT